MILSSIYIAETKLMGRGVFTSANIDEGTVIEESPVIVMSKEERKLLDQTLLHDYIFEWGEKKINVAWHLDMSPLIITLTGRIANTKWILKKE